MNKSVIHKRIIKVFLLSASTLGSFKSKNKASLSGWLAQ